MPVGGFVTAGREFMQASARFSKLTGKRLSTGLLKDGVKH